MAITCGNPVRLVSGGGPLAQGCLHERATARTSWRHHDWIRTGLMFEPRGHDVMSGSILYPPTRDDCDIAILFVETSGCLPMCGHGTIGTVTMAIENGLVDAGDTGRAAIWMRRPAAWSPTLRPAGRAIVESVRITNVRRLYPRRDRRAGGRRARPGRAQRSTSPMAAITTPSSSRRRTIAGLKVDVGRRDPCCVSRRSCAGWSTRRSSRSIPRTRRSAASAHVMWTGKLTQTNAPMPATPCSTATRRSTAHRAAPAPRRAWPSSPPRATLRRSATTFVHESDHRLAVRRLDRGDGTSVGNHDAHRAVDLRLGAPAPAINTIFVDDRDPFAKGFQV